MTKFIAAVARRDPEHPELRLVLAHDIDAARKILKEPVAVLCVPAAVAAAYERPGAVGACAPIAASAVEDPLFAALRRMRADEAIQTAARLDENREEMRRLGHDHVGDVVSFTSADVGYALTASDLKPLVEVGRPALS